MTSTPKISRRTVLRGIGTAVALPMLEGMLPSSARAAGEAAKAPTRMAFVFVPNGIHMPDWAPGEVGANFALPKTLEPLAPVKKSLTVFSGLAHEKAEANGDGPGDHARSAATFLTGCQARKTHGADINVGVSIDQLAAQKVGQRTTLPSLELGVERGANAGNCDSGYSCAYSHNISWRTATTPQAKEINPRSVFDRLFGGGAPEDKAAKAKRQEYRKSILDFVLEDARDLRGRIGISDQRKLDEYLSSVREIEQRIQAAERSAAQAPQAPARFARPSGVPDDNQAHLTLMFDLLHLAFQADITRIATFMMANEGSNRAYRNIGVSDGHHDLSHHGNNKDKQAQIAKINRYHMERFAAFLKKMQDTKEGAGSLLDHSMVLYGCAIGDGNRHNHDKLPILVAGGGNGTLSTGEHLRFARSTPLANLFLNMLDGMGAGAGVERFGDSTGRLEGLRG
jgi:hypothetical protein